ncbi:MAG: flagellar motor switch protein FliG [Chitinivibrionia bacterium]|nr:flagellar motor switch protein FliG [Chitinivibrionia bacterium]
MAKTETFYEGGDAKAAEIISLAKNVPGPRKAAIVMVALGSNASSQVLKHLDEKDVERLTTEIARLSDVSMEVREAVLQEFTALSMAYQYIAQGGVDYAREILEDALGTRKAKEIMERVQQKIRTTGFNLLEKVDPTQLVNFMRKEHPQTIALLLAHMGPQASAPVLAQLAPEIQVDVAARIAMMDSVTPETLDLVEEVLIEQIKSLFGGDVSEIGGIKAVAEILNNIDRSSEKNILDNLERENPELATEIKNLMFVFEDIMLLDDGSMRKVLKEVNSKDLSIALKGASPELTDKFMNNMSMRAAEMLREEISYLPPMRLKEVEESQQKVVDVVRRLEEKNEIIISGRGGSEEIIV